MRISDRLNFSFSKKLPVLLQSDSSENGLICIAMVVAYYQGDVDLYKLKQDFPTSSSGMTQDRLLQVLEKLQFDSRKINIDINDIDKLSLPAILLWKENHFVVLKEVSGSSLIIHDPSFGEINLLKKDLSGNFNGTAIEIKPKITFSKNEDDHSEKKTRFSWKRLLGSTEGLNRSLLIVCALALAMEILVLIIPLLNQLIFDQVVVTSDTNLLTIVCLGLIFLEVTRILLNTVRGWSVMIMSATLNIQWISNIFSHLIRLPIPWFDKRHMGDICSRFEAIHPIQGMVTTRSIEVGLDGLMSIGALIMMFIYSPLLAIVVIITVILYFFIRALWYRYERNATEAGVIFSAQQQSLFLETLRCIRTIRLFNAAEDRKARWVNSLVAERNAGLRKQRLSILMEMSNWTLFGAERIIVTWLGILAVIENEWSIGMLLAFIAYKDQFAYRAIGVVDKVMEFKLLGIQTERLSDIVLSSQETHYQSCVDVNTLQSSMQVNNISFRYSESDPLIINNCNFMVNPGESIAIIGASGCGKTTLLKLMLGVTEPESGQILYGGKPLQHVGTREYRDLIGVVMQDDQLLSGTIAENISFFSKNPDHDWIETCAKTAAIHNEIISMNRGYHTLVGDMGVSLSGGQKQRVLLARALYKRPKILFLDEATSHLDIVNETLVNNSVRKLGITTIVIAHRPETIRMADRILLMETGMISEVDKDIIDKLTSQGNQAENN